MRLYNSEELLFENEGICSLSANISWEVTEVINGEYELEMVYPIDDENYKEIQHRRIIYAKPNPHSLPQPFRIYDITTSINRTVVVNAAHISYDLSGYPVEPFKAGSAVQTMNEMNNKIEAGCPFTFRTDITEAGEVETTTPKSARAIIGNNISRAYSPQLYFDKFIVNCNANRGRDNGVEIRYGKNMLDMKQEENNANVYTAVYPYWYKEDEDTRELLVLPEKTIPTPGTYNYKRVYILDVSNDFDGKPTIEQIRDFTNKYITDNKLGIPKVSLTLSFIQLSSSTENSNSTLFDKVNLGDTVKVVFEAAGVETTARCIKTVYNGKKDRYESIEIGEANKSLADSIVDSNNDLSDKIDSDRENNRSYFETAMSELTNAITGNSGGHIRLNPPKNPNELLIMDNEDINKAVIVWRLNQGGIGVSRNGYNGPYVGIGQNGKLVIDEATAYKISALLIEGGLLKSFNDLTWINMDNGTFNFANKIMFDGSNVTMKLNNGKTIEQAIDESSNSVKFDFTNSGGSNIVLNSGFRNGMDGWWVGEYMPNGTGREAIILDDSNYWVLNGTKALTMKSTNQTSGEYRVDSRKFPVKQNTTYTLSYLTAAHRVNRVGHYVRGNEWEIIDSKTYVPGTGGKDRNAWTRITSTFNTGGNSQISLNFIHFNTGDNAFSWVTDVSVTEGTLAPPWSPNPTEIYEYNTTIDRYGITIRNGALRVLNANGTTTIDASKLMFRVLTYGNGSIVIPNGQVVATATVKHNLGYRPVFKGQIGYINTSGDTEYYSDSMTLFKNADGTLNYNVIMYVNDTDLVVIARRANDLANSGTKTFYYRYFIEEGVSI